MTDDRTTSDSTDTPHPSDQQLSAFILGQLDEEQSGSISEHLVDCEACCQELEQLSLEPDGFVQKLQQLSGPRVVAGPPARSSHERVDPPRAEIPGYELIDVLGRGGMGVVYRARQTGLNRMVALKMVSTGDHAAPAELVRFRSEAEAVARLRHPNIVQIFDTGTADGHPYFAMELVGGGNLQQRIAGAPQNPQAAARLVGFIAEGVQAAHAAGIIHRDLKPANILLRVDDEVTVEEQNLGTPLISDFGLARQLDRELTLTETGAIAGTPGFMAPEQASGLRDSIDVRTDVYALGAILYNLLTGRPPFQADTPVQVIRLVVEQDPVAPRALSPGIDHDLETICLKCLEKEPHRRYASAAEFGEDLSRYLAGEPIHARKIGPAGKLLRWSRRNRVLATVSATLALVLLAAAIGGPIVALAYQQLADDERKAAGIARIATGEAEAAERQATDAATRAETLRGQAVREAAVSREVSFFLLGMFDDADPLAWSGRAFGVLSKVNPSALEMVDRGAQRLADKSMFSEQPLVRATLLDKIGDVYLSLGRADRARPLLTESLELRKAALESPHPLIADSLHRMGFLHFASGEPPAARDLFEQALAMRTELLGPEDRLTLQSKVQLGIAWLVASDRARGEELLQEALVVWRNLAADGDASADHGVDVQWRVITLAALIYRYLQQEDLSDKSKGLPLLTELQDVLKELPNKRVGAIVNHFIEAEKSRHAARLMARVSSVAAQPGVQRANAEFLEAMRLTEEMGHKDHYLLAWMRREYAYFLFDFKRYVEAERAFTEALRVFRLQFDDTPENQISHIHYQIARSIQRGRYARATDAEERAKLWKEIGDHSRTAIEIDRRHPDGQANYAVHAIYRGVHLMNCRPPRYPEAEALLREAVAMRRNIHGAGSTPELSPTATLLSVLISQDKHAEAREVFTATLSRSPKRAWSRNGIRLLVESAEYFAERGESQIAVDMISESVGSGFRDAGRLRESGSLDSLRELPEFQALVKRAGGSSE